MPSGYTTDLYDGKEVSFEEFMLRLAHAFIPEMRDAAPDAEIPETSEPSPYYLNELREATEELRVAEFRTDKEWDRLAQLEFERQCESARRAGEKSQALRERYEAMRLQVLEWQPPSPDHAGLKKFALDQLQQSIDFDTGHVWKAPESPMSGANFRAQTILNLTKRIERYAEEIRKERERAERNTRWVRELRQSLSS